MVLSRCGCPKTKRAAARAFAERRSQPASGGRTKVQDEPEITGHLSAKRFKVKQKAKRGAGRLAASTQYLFFVKRKTTQRVTALQGVGMGQAPRDGIRMTRRAGLFGAAALGLSACASPPRGPAVPFARTREARALGLANERFFLPWDGDAFRVEAIAAQERARRHWSSQIT